MSVQGEKLSGIAAAIREKEGSSAPICACDFAARIRALPAGGQNAESCFSVLEDTHPCTIVYTGEVQCAAVTATEYDMEYEIIERT